MILTKLQTKDLTPGMIWLNQYHQNPYLIIANTHKVNYHIITYLSSRDGHIHYLSFRSSEPFTNVLIP
jgi:hypothetical protein